MSLSPLVTLTGIGGGGVVVTEGQVANQVVVMQGEKVVLFNMEENCVEKTWYGGTGRKIKSAVSALGMFGGVKVIMVVDRRTIVWGDKENKVENCDKLELDKDIRELVVLDKQHWVVFDDGSVEQLEYFKNNDREEWVISTPVAVVKDEVILQTRLVQTSPHTVVSHLVKDTNTANLVVVKGHVVLDSETQSHSVTVVDRITVCLASEVVCHDLARDLTVALIKTNGSLCVFNTKTSMEEEVMKVPSTNHTALTHTTAGQVAVMGALPEGGFLQLVSTKYRAVVAETKLKNTSHKGKGIFLVRGRLYMSISSRVMTVQLGSNLKGGLDMLLGKLAQPQAQISYNVIPDLIKDNKTNKLEEIISRLEDIPEQLLLDCIIYFLDPDRTDLKEGDELRLLSILFGHSVSQAVMSEEVSRLSLEQVIKLCKVLDMLIHNPEEVECAEENLLEWVSMLITSHYMQLVVSRDKDTLDLVNKLQETVKGVQESVKLMTDSRVLVQNIMNTKIPPIKNSNQAYCIEIIQI
eukprot:TRINITY_DN9199_c0_g1_i1.p1 TRINITY_DN9199_c0_g1~~TRINITY_DN9199_c0_g1_i1.p1  ORF type:complete len:522 (+),score=211.60 TRINITY_DN9199_c0_g1_i1:44-1609(+)